MFNNELYTEKLHDRINIFPQSLLSKPIEQPK